MSDVVAVYDALLGNAEEARFEVSAVSNFASDDIKNLKARIAEYIDILKILEGNRLADIKKINDKFYAEHQKISANIFEMRKRIEELSD